MIYGPQDKGKARLFLAGSAVFLAFCAFPASHLSANSPPALETKAIQALKALDRGAWSDARSYAASAKDPLTAKIFFWMMFSHGDEGGNFTQLTQFVRGNPDWPRIGKLEEKVEKTMPADMAASSVIAWFNDYKPKTARGVDLYLNALITSGQIPKAREFLAEWWATTPLAWEYQRDLFRKYNRYINTAAHHKRLDMLLLEGNYDSALGIAEVLQQGYPQLAQARIGLAQDAGNVEGLIRQVPAKLQNDPGLLFERLRWRRKNDMNTAAIEILSRQPDSGHIQNPDGWWKERNILIRRMLEEKNYKTAYSLASSHGLSAGGSEYADAEWLAGWLGLRFMKDPRAAFTRFQNMHMNVKTPISISRAAYWAARAAQVIGDQNAAARWFREAARFQSSYYGQLAAAELSMSGESLSAAPPKLTDEDFAKFRANELIRAARLFNAAGMKAETSAFIKAFVESEETPKAYLYGAELASDMERYYDAISIAKKASTKGMFLTAQAYPLIQGTIHGAGLEKALIHALIRQESMFDPDARSPAGALGLMQLLPTTAQETARKIGVNHSTAWLTSRPEHNIRLGSAFLKRLLDKYQGAYPLAIAAYNAGPGRVDRWLVEFGDPREGQVDIIDWIELIPIYETRNYVQRVVEGTYVYRLRLKNMQNNPPTTISLAMPNNLRKMQ